MPSLYESTVNTGEVSSSNFTTLYNASGLAVANAGAGSITGNLNVGGNLIVQGTSTLIGAVNLQSTLSLPNYTFPLPDGTTDQVMVTDGSGNLYFTDISAIPGAAYSIQANTTSGGANLTLVDSAGGTDSVKFASGTNVTIVRTDENTITINSNADNIPDGTAAGQLLVWNGSDWTANNQVTSLTAADRFISEYKDSSTARTSSGLFRRNYASTPYTTGSASSIAFQLASDSQATVSQGAVGVLYDAAKPRIFATTSINNFTTSLPVFDISSTDIEFNGTNLVLNSNFTGATPTSNGVIQVERGSVETNATLTWDETQNRWEFNNPLEVQGQITGTTNLDLNGDTIVLRSGSLTQGNAQIIVNRGASPDARLTWNDTQDRWEFNESLFGSTTAESPAQFERKVTSAEISNSFETKTALRLTERVTDAASNATDQGGTSILFTRASGTTPGSTERLYANIASRYYGTTNTADIVLQWSDDNFSEPSPGVFPGTYTLLRAGADDAAFFNNSLYIDYSTLGAAQVGINTNTPGYNLDVVGDARISTDLTVDGDINVSGVKFDLSTPVIQGQMLTVSNVSPATITNSSSIIYTAATARPTFIADTNTSGRVQASAAFINDTGAAAYGQGDGGAILLGVDSDSQARTLLSSIGASYDTGGNHQVRFSTSTNNFTNVSASSITGGNTLVFGTAHGFIANQKILYLTTTQNGLVQNNYYYVIATGLTTTQCQVSATLGGTAAALTNGTGLTLTFQGASSRVLGVDSSQLDLNGSVINLNYNGSGVAGVNASLVVNRGTSGANANMTWNETTDRWEFNNSVYTAVNLAAAGNIAINRDASDADAVIAFYKPTTGIETIIWNKTTNRFELSNNTEINGDLAVDGGDLTTTSTTGNLFNTTATTVNIGNGATTEVNLGANSAGRVQIKSPNVDLLGNNINLRSGATVDGDANITVDRGPGLAVIKWDSATDRWETSVDGVNYLNIPNQNLDLTSDVTFGSVNLDGAAIMNTFATTRTSTAQFTVDQTTRNIIKAMVYMERGADSHTLEILIMRTPTDAMITTYGEMYTSTPLATFTADQSGGQIRILATPTSATSTTFSTVRTALT